MSSFKTAEGSLQKQKKVPKSFFLKSTQGQWMKNQQLFSVCIQWETFSQACDKPAKEWGPACCHYPLPGFSRASNIGSACVYECVCECVVVSRVAVFACQRAAEWISTWQQTKEDTREEEEEEEESPKL